MFTTRFIFPQLITFPKSLYRNKFRKLIFPYPVMWHHFITFPFFCVVKSLRDIYTLFSSFFEWTWLKTFWTCLIAVIHWQYNSKKLFYIIHFCFRQLINSIWDPWLRSSVYFFWYFFFCRSSIARLWFFDITYPFVWFYVYAPRIAYYHTLLGVTPNSDSNLFVLQNLFTFDSKIIPF